MGAFVRLLAPVVAGEKAIHVASGAGGKAIHFASDAAHAAMGVLEKALRLEGMRKTAATATIAKRQRSRSSRTLSGAASAASGRSGTRACDSVPLHSAEEYYA